MRHNLPTSCISASVKYHSFTSARTRRLCAISNRRNRTTSARYSAMIADVSSPHRIIRIKFSDLNGAGGNAIAGASLRFTSFFFFSLMPHNFAPTSFSCQNRAQSHSASSTSRLSLRFRLLLRFRRLSRLPSPFPHASGYTARCGIGGIGGITTFPDTALYLCGSRHHQYRFYIRRVKKKKNTRFVFPFTV